MISVIVPVYNEQQTIKGAVDQLLGSGGDIEVIVADGNGDSTISLLEENPRLKLCAAPKGRAGQMNAGAALAAGETLLFLHADTRLPEGAFEQIAQSGAVFGAFDLRIDSPRLVFRVIERAASWRTRLTQIPYGDQAVFVRRELFEQAGGFDAVPIMEDVMLAQKIKRLGFKPRIFKTPVLTSARRWEKEGIVYGTLRNWLLICAYFMGVHPAKLARWYK